ncbi:oligosaccharide flippase family protein [Gordonia sp. VNK1]|uniref:oligosaccharide flippase family protein n=1 Tax=Gordonia oleivorans TaxID=3156618 RepID=UPI0032B60468
MGKHSVTGSRSAIASATDPAEPTVGPDSTRAARNTASLLISRVAIAAMGWAGSLLIARTLSPDDFGAFSLVFGILGLMAIVTDLGVGRVVLGDLVKTDQDASSDLAGSFVLLRLALGLVGYVVAVVFVVVADYSAEIVRATLIGGLVVVIATPSHALSVIYQSRLRMTYVSAIESASQFVQLALTVAAVLWAPYLLILVLPAVANEVVAIVLKIRGIRRGVTGAAPRFHHVLRFWKPMLVEAIPLSIGFALIQATAKIDVLMLSKLDNLNSVGLYTVGYKFSDFVTIAGVAVSTPFMTVMVASWPGNARAFTNASRRAIGIVAGLGGLGITIFWPCATELIGGLYGARFAEAALATKLLVIGAVLAGVSQIALLALVSAGKHRQYPWLALFALALNVCLNLYFIPRFSYTGAAWVTLITEVVAVVAVTCLVAAVIPFRGVIPITRSLSCAALAAALIAGGSAAQHYWDVSWIACTIGGGVLYVVVAYILRITDDLGVPRWRGSLRR